MEPADYYSFALTSKHFYNILIEYFKTFSKTVIDAFNDQYKRLLHCFRPVMVVNKYKDFKGKKFYINLIIKAEIFSVKLVNQTISIGYLSKFFTDKTAHSNVFKFDVIEDSKQSNFWLMREYTSVRYFNMNTLSLIKIILIILLTVLCR
jgi:hypothetical protein